MIYFLISISWCGDYLTASGTMGWWFSAANMGGLTSSSVGTWRSTDWWEKLEEIWGNHDQLALRHGTFPKYMFPWLNFGRWANHLLWICLTSVGRRLLQMRWRSRRSRSSWPSSAWVVARPRVRLGHGFFGIFQPALAQDFGETTSTQVFVDVFWRFEDAKGTAGICWA